MTDLLYATIGIAIAAVGVVIVRRQTARGPVVDEYVEETLAIAVGRDVEVDLAGDARAALLSSTSLFGRVVAPVLRGLAERASHMLPRDQREQAEAVLTRAGVRDRLRGEDLLVGQGSGAGVGVILGLLFAAALGNHSFGVFGLAGLGGATGWVLPRRYFERMAEARQLEIRRDLPNVIDLLRVTVRAGATLEGAISLVIEERNGALVEELSYVLAQTSLGSSRRDALASFRDRVDVTEVNTLVSSLLQADELGMPLSRVLEVQADELRTRRQQWAREQAAKLPVKVLGPLVVFIFPPILIVTLGPAVSQISTAL